MPVKQYSFVIILFMASCMFGLAHSDEARPEEDPCGSPVDIPDCTPKQDCRSKEDTRNCITCLIRNPFGGCLARGNDPYCEAAKAAQNRAYEINKIDCEANKAQQRVKCESTIESLKLLNKRIVECKEEKAIITVQPGSNP